MSAEMARRSLGAAVIVASDRVSEGRAEDRSGQALAEALSASGWRVVETRICPDDVAILADAIATLADRDEIRLVLTTGGTGIAKRDVTPDATRRIADREVPGIAEALRAASLRETAHAMLSRATAAIRGATLIVNLPGSERGALSTFDTLAPTLGHAVSLLEGDAVDAAGHHAADR